MVGYRHLKYFRILNPVYLQMFLEEMNVRGQGFERKHFSRVNQYGCEQRVKTHICPNIIKYATSLHFLRDRFLKALDEYPVLILPNPGFGAWPLNEFPGVASMAPLTIANILGLPALAVPLGLDNTGLPLSVQLVAKPWHEELLLQMGENLEEARGAFPIAI